MLKFIALSGTTGVTENFYVYETESDMIIVDCGVGFPEPDMFGVDLVIPDFSYVVKNKNKLRAVFITHGHEDHLGALPFLFREVKAPMYATKLVAGFITDKFNDYGMKNVQVNVFDPEKDEIKVGAFTVTPFRVSHSVPDAVGFSIETAEGRTFHIPDYKFDWTPVDGRPFDVGRLVSLANRGAMALMSDSLGSTTEGYTGSEREIEDKFEAIVSKAGKKIFMTTISSNISRVQQMINVAENNGRKVAIIGRSIERKVDIAKRLGYLNYRGGQVVSVKEAGKLPAERVMYIISGSYGQQGSALYRASLGEHKYLVINKGDTVIFSSDPAPPGSKANVDFVVDRLFELGADVHYYDTQEDLHVSGHGSMQDINMLFGLVKPKYFVPIGGTIRHNRAYSLMAQTFGAKPDDVFELSAGDTIEFQKGSARLGRRVPVRSVMVDGLGIGDVGEIVLKDRQYLSKEGIVIAVIQKEKETGQFLAPPDIISRGFVFKGAKEELLQEASKALLDEINKMSQKDPRVLRGAVADFLDRFFLEKIGRRPMIMPVVVEV